MDRSLRVWSTVAGLCLVAAVSCREVAVTAVEVARVEVAPPTATLIIGERVQFSARVEDASGRELQREIQWNSTASQIATVTSTGEVLGLSPGTATISATTGGVRGEATVQVSGEPVARVEVQPLATTVEPGDSVRFQATAFANDGAPLLGRTITWSVETGAVATIRQNGWAIGQTNGITRIFATIAGVRGEATLSVRAASAIGSVTVSPAQHSLAPGETVQLTATARTGDGTIVTPPPTFTWTTSDADVATVSPSGLVTADETGTATITASASGASGTSVITVQAGPVATVEIEPSAISMVIGSALAFAATGKDAAGNEVTGATITWTSSNSSVASVNANGVATANALGNVFIVATISGIADSAAVLVVPEPVSTVAISPANPTLAQGDSILLQADLRSASGATLSNRIVNWVSGDAAVATIVSTGTRDQTAWLHARSTGTVTITATAEGRSDQTSATINPKPVASVQVEPASITVIVGGTATLQTVLRAADGTTLSGRSVTWTSSRLGVATVSGTGVVSGVAADTATITATAEGVSGTAKVTVSPKPVASVQIQPVADTVFAGDSVRFRVVLRAADNTILTQRQVTWSSGNTSIARVNPATGDSVWAVGVQPGSVTLTAVSEGVGGTASVVVQLKPVATVTIVPAVDTVKVGTGAWLRAVLRAADGTILTNRTINWSSGSTGIATVAPATGDSTRVTGVATGNATITATAGGVNGQATVRVEQAPVASITIQPAVDTLQEGATATLTAVVRDASGTQLNDRVVTWSSNSGVVSVAGNAPLGLTAGLTGNACPTGTSTCSAMITATAEGVNGTATVFVQKPVATITIAPPTATLNESAQAMFSADVRAADGTALTDRRVTWSTNITGRLSISPTGPFGQSANVTPNACPTGQTNCAAQLIATVGTVSGAAAITILKPVATVTVTPATASAFEGDQAAFTAEARAADGTVIADRTASWSFTGNGVTAISTSGPFQLAASVQTGTCPTGQGSCTATIVATVGTVQGTASLTVRKRVASVAVAPATATINENGSTTLTATPRAADNTALTDRSVTWVSSASGVAAVTGSGAFGHTGNVSGGTCPTGQPSCSATITATADGVSGTATVTVQKPITSIVIAPAAQTLDEGDQVTLTATATAADGTVINNRPLAWNSSDAAVASVAGNGTVQLTADVTAGVCPVGSGTCTATITAAQGTASGQAVITVVKQASAVAVTFGQDSVFEGAGTTAQAVVTAADGTVLADRQVIWSASNAFASAAPTGPFGQDANISTATCPTGQEACATVITATVANGGPQGSSTLTILKAAAMIGVSPTSATISVTGILGPQTRTFTAAATAADGTQIVNRPITWCFVDSQGGCTQTSANVTANTLTGPSVVLTARVPGTVTLRAQMVGPGGTVSAVATVNVIL